MKKTSVSIASVLLSMVANATPVDMINHEQLKPPTDAAKIGFAELVNHSENPADCEHKNPGNPMACSN